MIFSDKKKLFYEKHIARKRIARREVEPRRTLKPLRNIITDGTITNYSPHTITVDRSNKKYGNTSKSLSNCYREETPINSLVQSSKNEFYIEEKEIREKSSQGDVGLKCKPRSSTSVRLRRSNLHFHMVTSS